MIKKLRIKFVCVVMAIVTLMLGIILGGVIHYTAQSMEQQSVNMMRSISSVPFQPGSPGKPSGDVRLPFFTLQLDSSGDLISATGGYFDLSDPEFLQQLADTAMASDRETGELTQYNLRYLKNRSPRGYTLVFSDTTTERATLRNLLYVSLLIFLLAEAVFLGISVLLSHWTIRPVAKAWDQQRQFVADASHELKTPLSVIMANAELLQSDDLPDGDRKRFSGNILVKTYQMRSLVENMLEMARVDNGTLKMQFSCVDFSQLVTDAVLSFHLLYEEKDLPLQNAVTDEITVWGSEQHLYQVLDVLLDNALKYSSPQGAVQVNLTSSGRSCLLSVSSPGDALSKEDLKNIFKRFYRADKARSADGSYGLGLSIAESVVHSHKGRIWAQSSNGYNTFFVQLPLHH